MYYFKLGIKNFFKILKEEKDNIIGIIISPLVAMFLLSYIWSNVYVENIPFGVVDLDNTALSRTVIEQLKNSPSLDVNSYFNSSSDLEQAMKEKKVYGGIIIPNNFSIDVSMKKSPKAEVLVDGTNMLIGGNALSGAVTVLGTISAGTELKMLQGNGMYPSVAKVAMGTFSYVQRFLYDPQSSYIRNMMYTLIVLIIQMSFLTKFFIPLLIKEKDSFTLIKLRSKDFLFKVLEIIIRVALFSGVAIVSSFVELCLIKKFFSLPMRGDISIYVILMVVFFVNLIGFGLVFAAILSKMDYFVHGYIINSTLFMLTSGIAYPFYMMPQTLVFLIKLISPIAQVAIPLKILNLKGVGWDVIVPYIKESTTYTLIWIPIGIVLYSISILSRKYKASKEVSKEKEIQTN